MWVVSIYSLSTVLFIALVVKELLKAPAQRFALPALGRGRRSRPARKMIRRRKMLENAAESPASGARYVGRFLALRFLAASLLLT